MVKWVIKQKYVVWILIIYAAMLFFCQLRNLFMWLRDLYGSNYSLIANRVGDWAMSDWLINYEGGFVRRGLLGQLLFYLYELTAINIPMLLTGVNFIILLLFTALFVTKWRQYRLSVILLPAFFLLGGFWGSSKYMWFRRDILIFLLVWVVFICYQRALCHKRVYWLFMHLLSVVTILSHEASMFYMMPIILVHYFLYHLKTSCWHQSLWKTTLIGLPSMGTFLLCAHYKGNVEIANTIWNSWCPMLLKISGGGLPLGAGLDALTWGVPDTFYFHLNVNFNTSVCGIPSVFLWPIIFLAILYLLVNINKFKVGIDKTKQPFSLLLFVHILLIVYLFLLPMFTVLSCDYKRVILYWVITSFLFYFSLLNGNRSVFYCRKVSMGLKRECLLLSRGFWANKWVFFIVFLFAGTTFSGFSLREVFNSSIIGFPISALYRYLSIFVKLI